VAESSSAVVERAGEGEHEDDDEDDAEHDAETDEQCSPAARRHHLGRLRLVRGHVTSRCDQRRRAVVVSRRQRRIDRWTHTARQSVKFLTGTDTRSHTALPATRQW